MAEFTPINTLKLPYSGCLEIKVKLTRRFTARLRLGIWLIKLGAKVMPINSKVEIECD